jgi:hypothetical protein
MKNAEHKNRRTLILSINDDIRTRERGVRGEKRSALPPKRESYILDGDYDLGDVYVMVGTL